MSAIKKSVSAKSNRRRRKALKPVKSVMPRTVDENLKKLAKSTIPATFVRKHAGSWNHQDWLEFLAYIKRKGYEPICQDRVGLILEACKSKYQAEHSAIS